LYLSKGRKRNFSTLTGNHTLLKMTRLLIVAATTQEAQFLSHLLKKTKPGSLLTISRSQQLQADVLITGPGIAATTYHLTNALSGADYDFALNIGICGSHDPAIKPVRVVNIIADQFGDFGAEDGDKWLDIFDLGLTGKNEFPFRNGKLQSTYKLSKGSLKALPVAEAVTVQRSNGSAASCKKVLQKYGRVMESMEGAAFFYVCNSKKVKCLQIRAVSNMVTRRNRKNWKIKEALDALAGVTGLFLLELDGYH